MRSTQPRQRPTPPTTPTTLWLAWTPRRRRTTTRPTAPQWSTTSGSQSYDMGARRFGPDVAHFLQTDLFQGALSNVSLALDPLTQNRYAVASGNPIGYVEWDGHLMRMDDGAGATRSPNPQPAGFS